MIERQQFATSPVILKTANGGRRVASQNWM